MNGHKAVCCSVVVPKIAMISSVTNVKKDKIDFSSNQEILTVSLSTRMYYTSVMFL